ncbi:histone H1-like [Quillaja saponaria]|uniref:Histone H1-like n=1 Tax=Quillaja saponaria TaxID=32244 RepID=A0AAD7Q195_QUISA|nr:histone H1-like [Quillaja saponaria]
MAKANVKGLNAIHPPYFEMISEALTTLNDRTGSSQQAIAKFIEDKYKKSLPPNFKKMLSVQLKKFVKSERLFKVKNSFKLSSTEKLKLVIKESQKKKITKPIKQDSAPKNKRLGQIKTPEVLKKADKNKKKPVVTGGGKLKRLSQVKTPEWVKKNKNLTPIKRKSSNPMNSSRPTKKAKK